MRSACFSPERAFATVNTAAIAHNFCLMDGLAKQVNPVARTIAVVKANAYGHGVAAVLPALLAAGCDFFAVATLPEALEVRGLAPEADILILGYTPPAQVMELARHRIIQTVFSAPYAAALAATAAAAKCHVRVHIKLDCGLARLGLAPEDTNGLFSICRRRPLEVCGLYTHFPAADTDPDGTKAALERFLTCRAALAAAGHVLFAHAAASAAALTLPESVLDGIRVGLSLYGIAPVPTKQALSPALSLCAPIVQLRELSTGASVGYGGDFVTTRPTRIGTLPIGYADGLCRRLTGLCVTLCHGEERFCAPIVGRISMDQLTLDLTDTPATVGDTVILWQDATAIAARLETIPYEVLTAISPRVRRIAL